MIIRCRCGNRLFVPDKDIRGVKCRVCGAEVLNIFAKGLTDKEGVFLDED